MVDAVEQAKEILLEDEEYFGANDKWNITIPRGLLRRMVKELEAHRNKVKIKNEGRVRMVQEST